MKNTHDNWNRLNHNEKMKKKKIQNWNIRMNKQSDGHRRNGLSQVLALNEKGRSFGGGGGGGGGGCGTRALVTLGLTTGHTPMKNVNSSDMFLWNGDNWYNGLNDGHATFHLPPSWITLSPFDWFQSPRYQLQSFSLWTDRPSARRYSLLDYRY